MPTTRNPARPRVAHPCVARLNVRMHLQRPDTTEDDLGGRAVSWTTLATIWAGIEPLEAGAQDGLWHDQPAGRLRARIWLRRHANATPAPGMRLLEQASGRIWHIEAVTDPDGGRHHIVCLCRARPS